MLALDPGRVGERAAAVRRLAIERRALVRVLAVAQVVDLLEDERQMAREGVARHLVEVGGDLGVVGGHRAERLGGQLGPRLGRDRAELAQLGCDDRVVGRVGDRRHPGGVARRGAEERRATDVDHLDRLVEPDDLDPDRRRERLDVDDHHVDQADPLGAQLLELGRDVAPGQDPGVDRVVEGLDLAADIGLALGQVGDGRDRDALAGEELARAVRGKHFDIEIEEVSRERDDAIPIRHRQQGSHPGLPPVPVALRASTGRAVVPRTVASAPHQSGRVYRLSWHTPSTYPHLRSEVPT